MLVKPQNDLLAQRFTFQDEIGPAGLDGGERKGSKDVNLPRGAVAEFFR